MISDIKFPNSSGVAADRAQKVWANIALHPWNFNLFRDDTSRLMQVGLAYDVVGVPGAKLDSEDVAEILRRFPCLDFKKVLNEAMKRELESKRPYEHVFHIPTRVAHGQSPLTIVDAPAILDIAPFEE